MVPLIKEILIGSGIALLIFGAYMGFDITPFILLGAFAFMLRFLTDGRQTGRRFEVLGDSSENEVVSRITFNDVGGQEVAKREFREALDFVKERDKVKELGIRPLKGILLTGPPGTGKTLMAKAAASYTDSIFLAASGSQFVEMYAGVGAQRIRTLFSRARNLAQKYNKNSAIIFIDEIEVLGGKRGKHSSHLEYDQTLNQLLVEMDGLQSDDELSVLVVGATNRADLLDDALLRPGRFDRVVKVDLPDREGRRHILQIHLKGKPIAPTIDLDELAKETFGFSGAHLESLVNEAAILAMRRRKALIDQEDFREGIEKVMMGEKLDRRPTEEELARIAYHEMGHALISEYVQPNSVAAVTVTSRGQALGYTRQAPPEEKYLYTEGEILGQIAICLGGAVAEEIIFGSRSTGAAGDFEQAVHFAKRLIFAGLSHLGIVSPQDLPGEELHKAVGKILQETEKSVYDALIGQKPLLQEAAELLIKKERIDGQQLRDLLVNNEMSA
ncbi:MAG: AAA family ATPase [Limnochordia bacterium]